MKYTLVTAKGQIMDFYIKDLAELYQRIYGGMVLTDDVLSTNSSTTIKFAPSVPR